MPKTTHRKAHKAKRQAADKKRIADKKLAKHKQDKFIQKLLDAQSEVQKARNEKIRAAKVEHFASPDSGLMSEQLAKASQ